MATISLRKAHQVRKNLVGTVNELWMKVIGHNSQQEVNKYVDLVDILAQYEKKHAQLIALKTAITKANINIYEQIITADELKSQISQYELLNVSEYSISYDRATSTQIRVPNTVFINQKQKEDKIAELKAKLETVLDAIDGYNSNTKITVDLD